MLKPDGVFAQWIQLYELDPEDLRMVLYGAVLIAAMLLFPGGVGGWLRRRRMMRWRRPGLAAR